MFISNGLSTGIISINKNCYNMHERVIIKGEIDNSDCKKKITAVRAKLKRKITCKTNQSNDEMSKVKTIMKRKIKLFELEPSASDEERELHSSQISIHNTHEF